jgi:uncharacterized protein (TIGR03435 family)
MTKGSLTIVNAPLRKIVAAAFAIGEDRDAYLLAGPDWISTERYDITASFPAAATADQMRLMLQALLATRFRMTFHRETKGVPVYALVQGKGELKLHSAAQGASTGYRRGPGHLETESSTLSLLADKLSQQSDRPVMDATGIKGLFAFKLDWQPDDLNSEHPGISLFTAIQEQLGLKLEARREPMDVVVVDSIQKIPTEN